VGGFPFMALPAAVAGVGNTVLGIAKSRADRGLQQRNKKKLGMLEGLEDKGLLGQLDANESRAINDSTFRPAADQAASSRRRAEQLMAAGGQASGADLVAGQKAEQGALTQGRQLAAQVRNQAGIEKKQQQLNEIEARHAQAAAMKLNDVDQVGQPMVNALTQATQMGVDWKAPQPTPPSGGGGVAPPVDPAFSGLTPEQIRKLQMFFMKGPTANGASTGAGFNPLTGGF
jgi:hypothetical protein